MSATLTRAAGPAPTATQETGFSTRHEDDRELARTAAEAAARYEMEGAIVMARRFPRDEARAFTSLMKACTRATFAADCIYSFPRGERQVEGATVGLAREAARHWGNVRYGSDIIRDDEDNRQIRGWAWDLETNLRVAAEDTFAKLIYRKKDGWVTPDERDLRELTNRRAALLVRNCLLDILPSDLIEDALQEARRTMQKRVADNPGQARETVATAFATLGVTVAMLEQYLKHPLGQSTPVEVAGLRNVYKSLFEGEAKWTDYVPGEAS